MSEYISSAVLPEDVLNRADVRAALRCHDFGKLFKLARQWGGISFVKIADACDIKPERVGRLARGEGSITTYEKIARIADAMRIPGHLIGLLPRPWEKAKSAHAKFGQEGALPAAPCTPRTTALSKGDGQWTADLGGEEVQRRKFLATAGLAGLSGLFPENSTGYRIGRRDVEHLRRRTVRLRSLDDVLGGADTRHVYRVEWETTRRLMQQASYTEATGRQLLAIMAEQAQQAGWTAFDAGDHKEASAFYRQAHQAAKEAGDPALEGNSLAFMAYQQVSVAVSGVAIANASCEIAGTDAPPTVRALLHERRAWAHAKAGDAKEAERALLHAENALDSSNDRPGPDWASWVDSRELQIMKGRCWTELRRPLRAVPVLKDTLSDFSDTHARDKALYLTWLAHAYLDAGEAEEAAAVIGTAMDLSTGVGSVRPRQRTMSFLARLRPYRSVRPVAEVLDRAAV